MVTSPNNPDDIVNMALGYIGEAPIRTIATPDDDVGRLARRYYHNARRYCLTLSTWNFAKKQADISKIDDGVDFTSIYQLPEDFITFLSVEGENEYDYKNDYDIRGDTLHYNSDDNSVTIRYVFDEERVTKWSPGFVAVVARYLAIELAYGLTKKDSIIRTNDGLLRASLADAIAKDGGERPPLRIEESRMLRVRRRLIGGQLDDPTVIHFDA